MDPETIRNNRISAATPAGLNLTQTKIYSFVKNPKRSFADAFRDLCNNPKRLRTLMEAPMLAHDEEVQALTGDVKSKSKPREYYQNKMKRMLQDKDPEGPMPKRAKCVIALVGTLVKGYPDRDTNNIEMRDGKTLNFYLQAGAAIANDTGINVCGYEIFMKTTFGEYVQILNQAHQAKCEMLQ